MQYLESDLALLQRFTEKGDQAAFSEIVRRYAGMVFAVGRRVLGDRARAEEVSQETFFRLMTRPDSVTQSLGGWLHRAATRLAVDERRSETARRRRELEVAQETADAVAEPPPARWTDVSPHIDEALAALPERSRLLLIRHFLQGRQQQELAREANVSAATISRRIKLAADELRRELRRRGLDVMPGALLAMWGQHAIEHAPQALLHELGKMSMISGPRVVAHKSAFVIAQKSAVIVEASTQARWGIGAFFLSALVMAAIEAQMHLHWLDKIIPNSHSANVSVAQLAGGDAGPMVNIPGPADFDSKRAVSFQQGGAANVAVTFADQHTTVMPWADAKRLIEKQTGKPIEQLAQPKHATRGP